MMFVRLHRFICYRHAVRNLHDATRVSFANAPSIKDTASFGVAIHPEFVSEAEEQLLVQAIEPMLKRSKYEYKHWDNVIIGYREVQKSPALFPDACRAVLERPRALFPAGTSLLPVHILDLERTGFISPHVDSVKFSGPTLCGLSLLSDCIMRLRHPTVTSEYVELLLRARSLYVLTGPARYEWAHEILPGEEQLFDGREPVRRGRRISLLFRDEAPQQQSPILRAGSLYDTDT
eukprot:TRINITY_DN13699_c0_g1_i1.p1 TRINITY_DN13699_c0_g1~~TRINITY_DN13699_c0_g1_i1.p1  ORF type:complete len:234 (+),score=43.84 TRINITY_DN13699_c0_g1_i1:75-776(+)